MTPERWHRVTEIFHSACERPPSQVEEFLHSQCGEDAELYSEVSRMLDAHRQSGLLDHRPLDTPPDRAAVFAEGQIVSGRYRIVRFLNRGGMGEVYEAEDQELNERVALKTLLPAIAADARMIARFKLEIQLSRKISHPNVCNVHDLARHPADGSSGETTFFLTMEFLPGETLSARLDREGRMACETALPLVQQMAEALEAAHRAGVIHRDFKPSNVMLVPSPEGPRAVVTDFGLARSFVPSRETTATRTEGVAGTLDYMAPELLAGQSASAASDVYALGMVAYKMVAYKMVAGALPFSSDTPLAGAILRSKVAVPSPRTLVPELDAKWERAILRALERERVRRFPRPSDFTAALRGEASSITVALPVMTRRRWLAAVAVVLALIAGAVGWRAWRKARGQPPSEAAMLYRKGVDDIHAGAYYAATKALTEAVRVAPHYGLAHARLAEAWVELEVPEKAGQEMLLARREDVSGLSRLDRLQIEAIDLTITREFAAAAARYEQIRSLDPDNSDRYVDSGRAYEKASLRDKAVERYLHAAVGPSHQPAAWLHLAILYSRASEAAKAAEAFQHAEELYQLANNLEGVVEVAFQKGIDANRRAHLEEAATNLRRAMDTARFAGNVQQQIRAELQLANNAYLSGDSSLTEHYAGEALDLARANQIEILAIVGLVNLGNAYLLKRDFAGAGQHYQEALELARRNSLQRLSALSLLSLASLHGQSDRPEAEAREAQEALAYFQPNHWTAETFNCLTLLGRARRDQGDYPAALAAFQSLLNVAEGAKDRGLTALGHESIGSVLFSEERYPEALKHYQENLELSVDDQHKAYAGLQCGNTLWLLGRYDEANDALRRADSAAQKLASLRLKLLRTRAEMALSETNYAEAATLARRALAADEHPDLSTGTTLTEVLGVALLNSGRKAEGLQKCKESFDAARKLGDPSLLLPARLALAQARLVNGDSVGALTLVQEAEPDLSTHPESRWRAYALMAGANRQYISRARQALDDLARLWEEAAYGEYMKRRDVEELSRPLLHPVAANSQ